MKNCFSLCLCLLLCFCPGCQKPDVELKVLQFNIWQEGTVVENGFEGIVTEIVRLQPELITFSEVRNYHGTDFITRILSALQEKGVTYYGKSSVSTGILSKYPIAHQEYVYPYEGDRGSVLKAEIPFKDHSIILYSAHLDYTHYACYLPRGYCGVGWHKLDEPVTDVDAILEMNRASLRDEAIRKTIEDANIEKAKGNLILLAGDFNEPSHLDWTDATKDLFDHQGTIIPWDCSVLLYENGFLDAYREYYPDPVTHPGFTFPSDNALVDVRKLTWAPEADERERIDFVYYVPDSRISLVDVQVVGPDQSIVKGKRVKENSQDSFSPPANIWPTDHKAVFAVFNYSVR